MFNSPVYVYEEKDKVLMVTNASSLKRYTDIGFKVITEEEVKKMPQYEMIKDHVE